MKHFPKLRTRSVAITLACLTFVAVPVHACSWSYPIWQNRDKNADPYYRFVRNGNMGFIDKTGKIVVQPTIRFYNSNNGDEFNNGLLLTSVASGPYIDSKGKVALDTGFSRNWDFSDGLAAAMRQSGENLWGYMDRTGKFVIKPKFEGFPRGYVYPFSNGRAIVQVGAHYGFIDKNGEFVIQPSYIWAGRFSEDRARVIVEGPCARPGFEEPCDFGEILGKATTEKKVPACRVRYIDKSGSFVGTNEFEDSRDFSEGLAAVQRNGKWGFIDSSGKLVIPFRFGSVSNFSDGLAMVAEGGLWEDKLWGYIDATGKIVIPLQFKSADNFSDGLAPVVDKTSTKSEKDQFYYIHKSGKRAFPGMFAQASPFFKGIGHVKLLSEFPKDDFILNGRFAYIDTKGRTVFSYEHDAREY